MQIIHHITIESGVQYSLLRRPSRTLYVRSWNARSRAGRVGRCDSVFGWLGTICTRTGLLAPFLLFADRRRASLAPVPKSAPEAAAIASISCTMLAAFGDGAGCRCNSDGGVAGLCLIGFIHPWPFGTMARTHARTHTLDAMESIPLTHMCHTTTRQKKTDTKTHTRACARTQ